LVVRVIVALAVFVPLLVAGGNARVFTAALILAFVVRLAYVLFRRGRRHVLSGWIFVIALGLLLTAAAGSPARRLRHANAAAVRQGVVAEGTEATPRDRCVGLLLDWWDKEAARHSPGWTKPQYRVFVTRVCRQADEEHVLRSSGDIDPKALRRIWTT
jgi:hypothetical protein